MSTFRVTIDTDNAAFQDDYNEVGRILRDVADRIEEGSADLRDGIALRDLNGNTVGRAQLVGRR